jgi:DNA (cytosine-5)-methyltransferase 1
VCCIHWEQIPKKQSLSSDDKVWFVSQAAACGFEIATLCEIDPFCQAVLQTHWPAVPIYEDIKEVSYARLEQDGLLPIDCIYGGVPCQPASLTGQRKGSLDERWLWPEFVRVVGDVQPRWCVAENPVGILTIDDRRGFRAILGALVEMGYRCGWGVWGACDVGAPHRRERVFLLGYREPAVADSCGDRQRNRSHQPERQSQCGTPSNPGLDSAHSCMADTASRQCQQWTQPQAGRDEVSGQRIVWPDTGGCGNALADAASGENRWRCEPGLQSNAASGSIEMANAQSGQWQWNGDTWTGQSRSANDSVPLADATGTRLEERAGIRQDSTEACPSTLRTCDAVRDADARTALFECGLGGSGEPPRIIPKGVDPYRRKRLHALGNSVMPAQVMPMFRAIAGIETTEQHSSLDG